MNSVELQVQRYRLQGIAEEMGEVLQRTAFSPNIKERRDFSCAICDSTGRLVAQAAHIPVHLGAIPTTMKAFIDTVEVNDETGYLVNDPYQGGTHLPDISFIKPVFIEGELVFYLINRAHHTDIGGDRAGSMSRSSDIEQEGFRTGPRPVTENGALRRDAIEDLLEQSRTPEQRVTDLEAQIASARRGESRLHDWTGGLTEPVDTVIEQLMEYSERFVRDYISGLPDTTVHARDVLDDDGYDQFEIPIEVTLTVEGDRLIVDYTDSADQVRGNLNCPRAVTTSATYYVVRCLIGEDVPMNQGNLRPISIRTRSGSVLDVEYPGPVAGGNVETSQRIVDVLLKALDQLQPGTVPAASQGTMNNVTLGVNVDGRDRSYYETLGGGAGAGPEHDGISGRQVHMTNTQNTPIEEFERRFPLRVDRLALRNGSGGKGIQTGGEGLIKSWTALEPCSVSLLTERRLHAPYGLRAEEGLPGKNSLERDTERQKLSGKTTIELETGDTVTVETPGGGGWRPAGSD
jgi:N-methylhydantoinase B